MAVLKDYIKASAVTDSQDRNNLTRWLEVAVGELGYNSDYVGVNMVQSTRFTAHMRLDSVPPASLGFLVNRLETIPAHRPLIKLTRYYHTGVDLCGCPYIKLSKIPQPNFREFNGGNG